MQTNNEHSKKDCWDKLNISASFLLPFFLGLVGYYYNSAIEESVILEKYTELAISILKEKPSEDNKAIRKLAIELLKENSQVDFSQQVEDELLKNELKINGIVSITEQATDKMGSTGTVTTSK